MQTSLIWVDFVIIGIIALSALIGFARGLIREVISLAVWGVALAAAWLFYQPVADALAPWIGTPSLRLGSAVLLIVVGVLIAGALVAWLLSILIEKTGLSGTDRLLGVVFGGARGAVLVALLVFLLALTPISEDPWWGQSKLIGQFELLADMILSMVPPEITDRVKSI
jgi:membrane protein required for colicin V production